VNKELELWHFIRERLAPGPGVMLLVVESSSGSSPGRRGYKLAVAGSGELVGSIGGGVMEVALVERSREILASGLEKGYFASVDQVHQKNSPNSSGMICSGRQTVILKHLHGGDIAAADAMIAAVQLRNRTATLLISGDRFGLETIERNVSDLPASVEYRETIGILDQLVIIGGGHCALALSELMSKLDFRISIFDDRPQLNTIQKNEFAHEITIIDSYERIGEHVNSAPNTYVVVMTLGYKFDEIVVRRLIGRDFRYFGVLGSRAKMATMLRELERDGLPKERLAAIHTPIGLPINSHTPEEIAVSIAAEIIQVRNS
jgi:xanthine dehydrogenase accessory factor